MSVKAYLLKDGAVVKGDFLGHYALKSSVDETSKQLVDPFSETYEVDDLVRPLYNPETLAKLPELNTWHYRACETKARDVAGDYLLQPVVNEPSEEEQELLQQVLREIDPAGEMSIIEILERFQFDYESLGNATLEIIGGGDNLKFKHIPAHTVRRTKDKSIYVQQRGKTKVYFKRLGAEFDLDYRTGEKYPLGSLPVKSCGNEILHLYNYTARSDYYGLPDVMSALMCILGDRESQKYNIDFFENHAVPAYAVTVTGTELDAETRATIQDYFNNQVKKSRHSTIVLTAQKENSFSDHAEPIEIKFEKLSVDVKDSSFRIYRQDNRDEILAAHGVPPYRAALAISGSLGQNVAGQTDEIYKNSVIDPRQTVLEQRINLVLRQKLEISDWEFKFVEVDTTDQQREDERNIEYFKCGVLTPNELRERLGLGRKDDPALDQHYIK